MVAHVDPAVPCAGRPPVPSCPAGRRARRPRCRPVAAAGPPRPRRPAWRRARPTPDHSASDGSWSATSGSRISGAERDVRRVAHHDVDGAVEVGEGVGHVAEPQVDRRTRRSCARAQANASGSASTACTRDPGTSVATASAIAPDPVHRSTTTGVTAGSRRARRVDRRAGHHLGLGPRHEDPRPDGELEVPEEGPPGDVLQRLAGRTPVDVRRKGPRRAAPATSPDHSARRSTPSAWAASSSASKRGDGHAGRGEPVGRRRRRGRPHGSRSLAGGGELGGQCRRRRAPGRPRRGRRRGRRRGCRP